MHRTTWKTFNISCFELNILPAISLGLINDAASVGTEENVKRQNINKIVYATKHHFIKVRRHRGSSAIVVRKFLGLLRTSVDETYVSPSI